MTTTELRELMAKATPGRWMLYYDAQQDPWVMPEPRNDHGAVCMPYNSGHENDDALLIVAMHTMLPKLLAVVEAAKRIGHHEVGCPAEYGPNSECDCPWSQLSAALKALEEA